MEIVQFSQSIHAVIDRYHDLIGDEAAVLVSEMAIDPPDSLQWMLEANESDRKNLRIGVVGRVKSGKSSLLNALIFDGKNILPKAATPMTAALTILTHGEKAAAEVEYYNDADIAIMEAGARRYEELLASKVNELKGPTGGKNQQPGKVDLEKIRKMAEKDLCTTLVAALARQYKDIQSQKKKPDQAREKIEMSDLSTLQNRLTDFVGAGGKYTPFTKSITLSLPFDRLQHVEIVDTPGINDPVVSREERTRHLLKQCDVVFVVSPSGQFMSHEDLDLMDRISAREGVNEIYLVHSKVDDQLQNQEEVKDHNGQLPQVLASLNRKLTDIAVNSLRTIRDRHPEVRDCYDKIIESPKGRVMHNSAICHALVRHFHNKKEWDEGQQHAWKLLNRTYPDFFSLHDEATSLNSLAMVAGIEQIHAKLDEVRDKKNEIIDQRQATFSKSKGNALKDFRDKLIAAAQARLAKINSTSVDDLEKKLAGMEKIKAQAGTMLDHEYEELVENLTSSVKEIKNKLSRHFRETKQEVQGLEESRTESYEVNKSGFISGFLRIIGCGGTETRTREVTSVRTGAVINAMDEMEVALEREVDNAATTLFASWRKELFSRLLKALRFHVEDESNLDDTMIRTAIRKVCASLDPPQLDFAPQNANTKKPEGTGSYMKSISSFFDDFGTSAGHRNSSLSARGTITGPEAEAFIEEAKKSIINMQKRLNKQIDNHAKALKDKLLSCQPAKQIFANHETDIEKLRQEINQLELTRNRINAMVQELNKA